MVDDVSLQLLRNVEAYFLDLSLLPGEESLEIRRRVNRVRCVRRMDWLSEITRPEDVGVDGEREMAVGKVEELACLKRCGLDD